MRTLLNLVFWGCGFVLNIVGVNAQELNEKQLLYETLSDEDRPAVKDEINKYYKTFFEKFSLKDKTFLEKFSLKEKIDADTSKMAQMKASGFSANEEPKIEPKVDEVLPITYVQLNDLKSFSEKEDPAKLILRQNAFVVPIDIPEKFRTKPSLNQTFTVVAPLKGEAGSKTQWKISQSGPSRNFQALVDGKKEIIEKDQTCKCFIIWIPALKQYFLGDQTSGKFKIKVLRDGPGGLKKGQLVSASEVFKELAKEANTKKYDFPEFRPQKPRRP